MISVIQLGAVDYEMAVKLQRTLVELRHVGRIPNVLLLLEHPPVITMGRNAKKSNVLAAPDLLKREGVEVFECDRGGDVTYHGPGQLVGYPIFDLRSFLATSLPTLSPTTPSRAKPARDGDPGSVDKGGASPVGVARKTLGAIEYVRRLEEALIRTCADFGVA